MPHVVEIFDVSGFFIAGELERVLGSDVAGLWQIITASDSVNDQETRTRSLTTWLWV